MTSEVRMEMAGEQKPMVTREQYDQARAVLDALPTGMYLHCSRCRGWKVAGGTVTFLANGDVLCEGCG